MSIGISENSKKLVYESNGASQKQRNDYKMGVAGSFVFAAFWFWELYSTAAENRYYSKGDAQTITIIYLSMCILFISSAFLCIRLLSICKTCWVRVYDDFFEAKTFTSVLKIELSKIDYVQINKFNLFITVGGKREKIICQDPEKLYSVLNGLVMNKGLQCDT